MRRELQLLANRLNSRKMRSSIVRTAGGVVDLCARGDTLSAIPFQEVREGGVDSDRHSHDGFVDHVASLVAFGFTDEQPNLSRWSVDNEVMG
jgi:hypothetical protein